MNGYVKPKLVVQTGHGESVESVAFSPDGRHLLTGSIDQRVILWDVRTGKQVRTFSELTVSAASVIFGLNGQVVFAGGSSFDERGYFGEVRFWATRSGEQLGFTRQVNAEIQCLALSSDGRVLAAGGSQYRYEKDDAPAPQQPPDEQGVDTVRDGDNTPAKDAAAPLREAPARLGDQSNAESGGSLAKALADGYAELQRLDQFVDDVKKQVSTKQESGQTAAGEFSNPGLIFLWDLVTGKEIGGVEGVFNPVSALTFSPDGRRLVSAGDEGEVILWDVDSRREVRRLSGHDFQGTSVAFSGDGSQVLAGSWDRSAILWDVETGRRLRTFAGHGHFDEVEHVAFSPDGRWVLTATTRDVNTQEAADVKESDRSEPRHEGEMILWETSTGLLKHVIRRHTDQVTGVAFSPDSRYFASSSQDHTAVIWDISSGTEHRAFDHGWELNGVVFSPDGGKILTAGAKKATLWDITTGKKFRVFEKGCSAVAFRPDGRQVLTDGVLWDVSTVEKLRTFGRFGGSDEAVAFSPDGRWAATCESYPKNRILLWDVETGQKIRAFRGHAGTVECLAFGPKGNTMLSASSWGDKRAILWDTQTGEQLSSFQGKFSSDGVESAALSPDGRFVLTGAQGRAILWDAATGQGARTYCGHTERITSVAFSPDGSRILTAGGGDDYDFDTKRRREVGEVILWDKATGTQLRKFQVPPVQIKAAAFSPDGSHLVTGFADGSVTLLHTGTGHRIRDFGNRSGTPSYVGFSPDGEQVQVLCGQEYVRWDLRGVPRLQSFPEETWLVSDDNRHIATTPQNGAITLWDMAIGEQVGTFRQQHPLGRFGSGGEFSFVLSPDKRCLLTSAWGFPLNGGTFFWDVRTGEELHTLEGHGSTVTALAFTPDGRHAVTGSIDFRAILWNVSTGKQVRVFKGHRYWITSLAVSPDGRHLLTGAGDSGAILWDIATGEQVRHLKGHTTWVNSVAFSPDGSRAASASADGTIILWSVASGEALRTFHGHETRIRFIAFSPDGRRMLTSSFQDRTARLWDVEGGRELCSMVNSPGGLLVATPDNYYMAPKAALASVAFRVGGQALPFEQFDLKFNRPDIVLSRLGRAREELIAAYRRAYQARLRRMDLAEEMLGDDFHLPEVAVASKVPLSTRESRLTLSIAASDTKYLLDRLNVYVNGVPVYGMKGISLRSEKTSRWQQAVEIELSAGTNRIQVSALNEKGAESLRESFEVVCQKTARKPDLYVVAVGVSEYRDSRYRLRYAHKDADALAAFFERKRDRFGRVRVLRILNEKATRENILEAKALLKQSNVDDQVILFFGGHGLLDRNWDYYFATYDINSQEPANRGLSYHAIEDLLDGILARRKLLLMDTCHSGELDKEGVVSAGVGNLAQGDVEVRSYRTLLPEPQEGLGAANSQQLLQEIFADLRRGTGAVVISAAGGAEFALESAKWKSGVFTYALLQGLDQGKADKDKDGRILVSELRDHVTDEVTRLTRGRQRPTVRGDNLEFDFPVF